MVGEHAFMFLYLPGFMHQGSTIHQGTDVKHFGIFTSFQIAIPLAVRSLLPKTQHTMIVVSFALLEWMLVLEQWGSKFFIIDFMHSNCQFGLRW